MIPNPPISPRTDTLLPNTTLFRSIGRTLLDARLKTLETGAALFVEDDDLAVDQRGLGVDRAGRFGQHGKAIRPVLTRTGIGPRLTAAHRKQAAIPDILHFMQTAVAQRRVDRTSVG